MTTFTGGITADTVAANLIGFLEQRTRQTVAPDLDLFGSGLVTSLFALELLVHLESTFGVAVTGNDIRLDNFRTVGAMTALVLRLTGGEDD
ncbi:hypothetical protein KIH74_25675 [Kineosporia sp. J2-2]|uniref:Carrier domain-containing protein n=1 Tax=Kineosporia corallincola TaxID=2835133 RepID=A0ABS5TMY6_9ACTN|nr:phosphopantetheine-binding protein [Kineosporia corallincola]MBT0772360.1 hypothetical protein [Kineosporia corallincola]